MSGTKGWRPGFPARVALRCLKRLVFAIFSCMLILGGGFGESWAGERNSSDLQPGARVVINQIDVSRFPDVLMYVSVFDDSGKLVTDLDETAFVVTEDEVEQHPVTVNMELPPVSNVLVVDRSGSMRRAMSAAVRAAAAYVDELGETDEVAVIQFSDKVEVIQEFTTDKRAVRNTLRTIKARGNTALYDAIYEAVLLLEKKKEGRKVIVVLTDGKDDDGTNHPLSFKNASDVISKAAELNIPIFTIGLGQKVDEGVLKKMADETGGVYYSSPDPGVLKSLYRNIGMQLKGQYVLRYTTNLKENDGSWHRVVVAVGDAYGRKRYRAPAKPLAEGTRKGEGGQEAGGSVEASQELPETNVLAASQGTRILHVTCQYDENQWAAKNLIDESIGKGRGFASCAFTKETPVEVLFRLPKPALVSSLIIDPFTTESETNWVKKGSLWVTETGVYGEYKRVVDFQVDNTRLVSEDPSNSLTEQRFSFQPVKARWVKLVLTENYGGNYMELGEVKLMGRFIDEGSETSEMKNILAAANGGKVIHFTSQYDDTSWAAKNLIDGKVGENHGYASESNAPAEILFQLPQRKKISRIAFDPYTTEDPSNWAKEVEVLVSTESALKGYKSVGKFTLKNLKSADPEMTFPPQAFDIDPVEARFIKLRLLSNHGGNYIELGEFMVFGEP